MRRDLDIDCDPAQLVLAPPDRSQLKEIFRRFEFRGLLIARRHARRGAARGADGGDRRRGAVARGRCSTLRAASATRPTATGPPSRRATASSSARAPPARVEGELVVHDAKALARRRGRRHAARRVPDRAGRARRTSSPTSRPSTASSSARRRRPRRRRPRSSRRRGAAPARRPAARAARGARRDGALPRDRAAAHARARRDGERPASRSTRTAWARSRRVSPSASPSSRRARTSSPDEEFMLGSTAAGRRGSCSRSSA